MNETPDNKSCNSPLPPKAVAGRARLALELSLRLEAEVARGLPADRALAAWLREHPQCGSRDRRFLTDAVYAVFRWRGWTGTVQEHGATALVLACALDGLLAPPVLHLAQAVGLHPAGWAHATDRSPLALAQTFAHWTSQPAPDPHALIPGWAVNALAVPEGAERDAHLLHFIAAAQRRPPLWLRAVGAPAVDVALRLQRQNIHAAAYPAVPGAVHLQQHPHLGRLEQAIGPCFEVQDLASQIVGLLCAPRSGERWLDLCAGAGGKTLHLIELAERRIEIDACDLRAASLEDLFRRARRVGVETQVRTHSADAPPQGPFDGVLVDAPCSGLGTWPRNADARWRTSPDLVTRLAGTQQQLLDTAAARVSPGGRLVYSVCTFTAAETEAAMNAFAKRHPEFQPEPVCHPLDISAPARARLWVWPWQGPCGGMFIARFRRRS